MNLFRSDKPKMLSEPVWATIETVYNPALRVKYAGTTWPAKLYDPNCGVTLVPGQQVVIVGVQRSITLLISVQNQSRSINLPPPLNELELAKNK